MINFRTKFEVINSSIYKCGLCHWPKCYHVLNWFFLSKPGFLEFIWIFSSRITVNQYFPHSDSKSYQINSVKSCSSTSFQQHQRHIPTAPKFSATINLIFYEKIVQYSRTFAPQVQTSWNQPMHFSSSRAFQRD
jgi:hypothetical protein